MASRWHIGRALPGQDALFSLSEIPGPPPGQLDPPELASYDILLANISGGKDSQTMLRVLVQAADQAGARDQIVCVFADLGDEDEWPGTAEIAARHAACYGLPFITVCRTITDRATVRSGSRACWSTSSTGACGRTPATGTAPATSNAARSARS